MFIETLLLLILLSAGYGLFRYLMNGVLLRLYFRVYIWYMDKFYTKEI